MQRDECLLTPIGATTNEADLDDATHVLLHDVAGDAHQQGIIGIQDFVHVVRRHIYSYTCIYIYMYTYAYTYSYVQMCIYQIKDAIKKRR